MVHISVGLALIGLGLWGVFDNWYYLMDLSKGAIPVVMIVLGLASLWIAVIEDDVKKDVNSGGENNV